MSGKCRGKCLDWNCLSFRYYLWESWDKWVKAIQRITVPKKIVGFPQVENGCLSGRYGFLWIISMKFWIKTYLVSLKKMEGKYHTVRVRLIADTF